MTESKAVDILRQELEKSDSCSDKVNHLAIQVKWGQNDLGQLGSLKTFLEKYPEVFAFEGQTVKLVNPKSTLKGLQGKAAPAAPPVPPSAPNSKAAAINHAHNGKGAGKGPTDQEDSFLDSYLNVPAKAGAGAPTSKAAPAAKGGYVPTPPAPPPAPGAAGKGKGKDKNKGGPYDSGKGGKGLEVKDEELKMDKVWDVNMTPEQRKQALQSDSLPAAQAQSSIAFFKSNGVDIELGLLSKKLVPGDEARQSAQRCLALVKSACSSVWGVNPNMPSVELCGSYAQGTEVHGAAMDLAFRLPAGMSFEDRANAVSELRSRLAQQTNFLETCDTLGQYPHTTSPLAIDLKGANPGLVAHILLEEQRVNRPPTNDEVIKQLCDIFPASYELIRLVKVWTVNHGLANTQEGFLNGIAWTLLVVFFLQKQKLVPPYSIVAQGGHITPPVSDLPLSSLLQNFYEFLGQRLAGPRGISLWTGEDFEGPPSVFIEDTSHFHETRQQRSLSETLGEAQWNRIIEESKKAFSKIKVKPGRWFNWADVFDPTDKKPTKIHGLGQHLTMPLEEAGKGDAKGCGKGMPMEVDSGKGCGKDADGKGTSSWSGKGDDGKGFGKDSDGKGGKDDGKGWGKDAAAKGGKDDGKGWGKDAAVKGGKDDSKGWGKDASVKGGKDDGKGWGKDADSKGWGKDSGDKGFGKTKDPSKGWKSSPY